MYNFLEIKCPNCGHQFVYLEHTYKGPIYKIYRRKGHNECLESTSCPNCNIELVVLKDTPNGINIQDKSIEVAEIVQGI